MTTIIDPADIMKRLVIARKRAGLSQSQAWKLLGYEGSPSGLSQYETGRSKLTLDLFLRMCDIYGVSPVWALTGVRHDIDIQKLADSIGNLTDDTIQILEMLYSLDRPNILEEEDSNE